MGAPPQRIEIRNQANASTILINVTGTSVNWTNGTLVESWLSSTSGRSHTAWNFLQATSITFGNHNLRGALLAPKASVTTRAAIDGEVAVQALTTAAAVRLPTFAGGFCGTGAQQASLMANNASPETALPELSYRALLPVVHH